MQDTGNYITNDYSYEIKNDFIKTFKESGLELISNGMAINQRKKS